MERGDDMRYFIPDDKYLNRIKELCSVCFDMEPQEVDYVFENNYISTDICCAVSDEDNGEEKLCCMLFMIPCEMAINGINAKGHYIYGACTSPQYRHRGLMHSLIEFANKQAKEKGDKFSVLLPANSGLYEFYSEMGYRPLYNAVNSFVKKDSLPVLTNPVDYTYTTSARDITDFRNKICRKYSGTVCYSTNIVEYAIKYALECGGGVVYSEYGYIIYAYNEENLFIVQEFMCEKVSLNIMLGLIRKICRSDRVMLRLPPWLSSENESFGMVKAINGEINTDEFDNAYLGLVFD